MKGYNNGVQSKFGLQQRKSSFADPYNETGRRKVGQEREVTKDGRERESQYVYPSQPPFPHLDTTTSDKLKHNNSFKSYETIYSTPATPPGFQARRQILKRDTPKRLPKLENVSGSLKLTSKNEVIEMIAEKPAPRPFVSKELPFQINKIEVTTLQAYPKLPNLPALNAPKLPASQFPPPPVLTNTFNNNKKTSPSISSPKSGVVRRPRSDSIKKVHELHQELHRVEKSILDEETKQLDIRQVQENIQQLQNIHQLHHTHTKQQQHQHNKTRNNVKSEMDIHTDGILQNLHDIAQIQENIHQTQTLLQSLQQKEKRPPSIEIDENLKLDTLLSTPPLLSQPHVPPPNPAVVLGSYLPRMVFRRFEEEDSTMDVATRGTFFDYFWGVVLFADISGFTAVTKRLLKLGTEGLEFLKNNLSDYFDDLVSLIHEMGGDVISFSGDAVVAVWWSETSKTDANERVRLARLASKCSLLIQESLSNRRYQIGNIDELVLNLRVAVSASHLCGVHVGGVNGRWLFTAYGSAITDIAEAMVQCVIGEVIISPAVWKLIEGFSVAKPADKFMNLQQTSKVEKPKPYAIDYAPEMAEWMKLCI